MFSPRVLHKTRTLATFTSQTRSQLPASLRRPLIVLVTLLLTLHTGAALSSEYAEADRVTVTLRPEEVEQGGTVAVYLENCQQDSSAEGEFRGKRIVFHRSHAGPNVLRSLLPISIEHEPGRYPVEFSVHTGSSEVQLGQVYLTVKNGSFGSQTVQIPPAKQGLLSESLLEKENLEIMPLISRVSPTQRWRGTFQVPVKGKVTSSFGLARVYNTGALQSRHFGIDFAAATGTPVSASNHGMVVFAGNTDVRGKTVFIDHGQGVFTGYYHLSELSVQPGQEVRNGAVIGAAGSTGRATASHLHWCMRVNGVFANPLQWAEIEF